MYYETFVNRNGRKIRIQQCAVFKREIIGIEFGAADRAHINSC